MENQQFEKDWQLLFANAKRSDEVLDGLKYELQTLAHYGKPVPDTDFIAFSIRLGGDLYRVFYELTDEKIFLVGVCSAIGGGG